ncbi:hypothetical protein CEUSTIGMA_g1967.t1 [Chlamydomonas eustigma]|uniref:UBC core domain-containing protein n=1 Tax=Chlamydomonas eustigma TaxID=1157962 RepID=A0A250WUN0_9CHLO|nr:hypothetical protein CEUSTIGMA_g1967.t1 [Chlamydomonas eustigma]|eukprot:GAX74518.1 hypothetical protein CEUSTIGMA_g1967.t1 [Chlamydomonas eustigma]
MLKRRLVVSELPQTRAPPSPVDVTAKHEANSSESHGPIFLSDSDSEDDCQIVDSIPLCREQGSPDVAIFEPNPGEPLQYSLQCCGCQLGRQQLLSHIQGGLDQAQRPQGAEAFSSSSPHIGCKRKATATSEVPVQALTRELSATHHLRSSKMKMLPRGYRKEVDPGSICYGSQSEPRLSHHLPIPSDSLQKPISNLLLFALVCPTCQSPISHGDIYQLLDSRMVHVIYQQLIECLPDLNLISDSCVSSRMCPLPSQSTSMASASLNQMPTLQSLSPPCNAVPEEALKPWLPGLRKARDLLVLCTSLRLALFPELSSTSSKDIASQEKASDGGRKRGKNVAPRNVASASYKAATGVGYGGDEDLRAVQYTTANLSVSHMGGGTHTFATSGGIGKTGETVQSPCDQKLGSARRQEAQDNAAGEALFTLHQFLKPLFSEENTAKVYGVRGSPATPCSHNFYIRSSAPVCAVLLHGDLPFLLRTLLHNDSLQDIASRPKLYRQLMELLRVLISSLDMVEIFLVDTEDPSSASVVASSSSLAAARQDIDAALPGSSHASGLTAVCANDNALLRSLHRLDTQCKVYKRSAEMLGQGDEEDITALCLALDLSALCEDVQQAVKVWQLTVSPAVAVSPQEPQALGQPGTTSKEGEAARAQLQRQGLTVSAPRRRKAAEVVSQPSLVNAAALQQLLPRGGEEGGGTESSLHLQKAAEERYVKTMMSQQLQQKPLAASHYFRKEADAARKGSGGELMRKRLKRITEELSTLSTSLPISWESTILVAVDEERMDVLRALMFPGSETPYAHGAFIFDIYLPEGYPNVPPKVQFLTTGGGRIRFNPNLYESGKVCLSLLGTWSGPSWQPGTSTLLQVLVSISAMILVPDPYFNEPGYERSANTMQGKEASRHYNEQVRANTMSIAVLPAVYLAASTSKSVSSGTTDQQMAARHAAGSTAKHPSTMSMDLGEHTASKPSPCIHSLQPQMTAPVSTQGKGALMHVPYAVSSSSTLSPDLHLSTQSAAYSSAFIFHPATSSAVAGAVSQHQCTSTLAGAVSLPGAETFKDAIVAHIEAKRGLLLQQAKTWLVECRAPANLQQLRHAVDVLSNSLG